MYSLIRYEENLNFNPLFNWNKCKFFRFIFTFLFQLILGMALYFLFNFFWHTQLRSFVLRSQCLREVELSSEHCRLANYKVLFFALFFHAL